MEILCSLIVPVYNEEKNIYKCLEVIDSQNYDELEVIFVNDGSTDNSKNILEEEIKKRKNFVLINQKNQGTAAARKLGIKFAKGDYIAILDCDDELAHNAIKDCMKLFSQQVDIVLFDLKYCNDNEKKIMKNFPYFSEKKIIIGQDALNHSLTTDWGVHGLGVYRKDVFLKAYEEYELYNLENYINNDEIITRLCFLNARDIVLSSKEYYYINNIESTTKKINKELYKKIYNSIILYEILKKYDFKFNYESIIISYLWEAYRIFQSYGRKVDNHKDWKKAFICGVSKIRNEKLFLSLSFKEKIKFFILIARGYI